jgi:aminopeptidase YwaD
MKYFFWLFLLPLQLSHAQKIKKADKVIFSNLQTHINFLADDKLEGRRTGTAGEKLAYEYIVDQFLKTGLIPKGENETYLQEFEVNDGRAINPSSHLIINNNDLEINEDFFPLPFCPNKSMEATSAVAFQESGGPWFYDLKELLESNAANPHFDVTEAIKNKAIELKKKGAAALIVFNSGKVKDGLQFESKSKVKPIDIPVLYISKETTEKYLKDETATLDIKMKILVEEKKRTGHNVIGYIDNKAANTIIIGAHYDHLGYGEDHNSMYTGAEPSIHNGADDNASGTAAIIEISKLLKASKFKKNNYLFIAFSGEELGLYGSKYFTEHPTVDIAAVNYMMNADMVGRLNDSSHAITVGGYGTSPAWGELITAKNKFFTIKLDSSGTGPSDHTSFYRKEIPVLFFFTGLHTDYHKPSDDAGKINYAGALQVLKYMYSIIEATDKKGKLAFTNTREVSMEKTSLKVTLGIMPDYTFSGTGVRVDGVSEGKTAQKAGIKPGDVLMQLNDYKFTDVQTYMETLNRFNKGDAAKVKLKRGKEDMSFDVVF